jgi:FkbM family methyltransferase
MTSAFPFCTPPGFEANEIPRQMGVVAAVIEQATRILPESRRHTCIQAGGNIGIFPMALARVFNQVRTFEPDPENWRYLLMNLNAAPDDMRPRIAALEGALGERFGSCDMAGGEWVANRASIEPQPDPDRWRHGPIGMIQLDYFQYQACDLICLDLMGYELQALKGAHATICQHRPVIVTAMAGSLQKRYGYEPRHLVEYMTDLDYSGTRMAPHTHGIFWPRELKW